MESGLQCIGFLETTACTIFLRCPFDLRCLAKSFGYSFGLLRKWRIFGTINGLAVIKVISASKREKAIDPLRNPARKRLFTYVAKGDTEFVQNCGTSVRERLGDFLVQWSGEERGVRKALNSTLVDVTLMKLKTVWRGGKLDVRA